MTNEVNNMEYNSVNRNATSESSETANLSPTNTILSFFLFIIAAFFEIGGGYLYWIALREGYKPLAAYIVAGSIALCVYGLLPTFQPIDSFGRIFAVYGGFFIVLSYVWGAAIDGMKLDYGDYIGSAIALAGVCIAWFWPR